MISKPLNSEEGITNSSIHQKLKAIYAEILLLPLDDIDSNASFLSLGGDSFKAVNLFQRCSQEGMRISFQHILSKSLEQVVAEISCVDNLEQDSWDPTEDTIDQNVIFPRMPHGYDFTKIINKLKEGYNLDLEHVEDIYPCSTMQQNIYVGQRMGGKGLYRTRGLFSIPSTYDFQCIDNIWQHIVNRHQTLRTLYVETSDPTSGRLLDAVVLKSKRGLVKMEHSSTADEVRKKFSECVVSQVSHYTDDGGVGFDHLITVYQCDASDDQILFQIDLNHITVDGASLINIIEEFEKGFQGHLVLEPATGYDRYIEYLQNRNDEDQALDYWVDYLDQVRPCFFPKLKDHHLLGQLGSLETIEMPLSNSYSLEDLRAFCRNYNITISNALQAVWALVLHIYTGDSDVCFGYLSSGRTIPISGVSEIVGPMMNLLVCRVQNINIQPFGNLLASIRDDFVNALPHQHFSIGKIQGILGTNDTRIFNTIVTSYYSSSMPGQRDNNNLKFLASHNATDFDLVLKVEYSASDIRIRLAYSTMILSHTMAENVFCTFTSILEQLIKLKDLESTTVQSMTISQRDLDQITRWNERSLVTAATHDFPRACVHGLIQDRVRLQPHAPAIYAWDGEMDYQTLDRIATAVSYQITSLGIGKRSFIPLCFEKSKWYSVALLGVLKSGNAFVPLDLSNPPARMRKIIDQLGYSPTSGLIICSREQATRCASLTKHLIILENPYLLDASQCSFSLQKFNPEDPAYVIFTSGTTGTAPKGVIISHGAYSFAARAHHAGLHIDSSSRVLQFASYGFDTSMEDHLTTLVVGGCLCVPSEEDRLSDLSGFAKRAKVNWAHITPSLAETLTTHNMPTMKTMVLGGEPMTGTNVRMWANPPATRLIQVYGPSECSVTSTINSDVSFNSDPTNIGTAFSGCATWVVKPSEPSILCAIGEVGELLMEGPILADGYLQQPELTASMFVRGLAWAPEKRLYRTGDLVKYDSNGQLHFVGRKDDQVKVRGQRIELGEIERHLVLEPHVEHALMLFPRSGPFANRMVAVISLTGSNSPLPAAPELALINGAWSGHIQNMRDFLLDRLPAYMIPDIWLLLEVIPRNMSGKLDRKKINIYLEQMTGDQYSQLITRMEEDKSEERLGSEVETLLRSIWSQVLNIPEIEIQWHTSFFYLGGDSISAMAVSSIARQKGVTISAADILRYRSIERVSKAVPLSPQSAAFEVPVEEQSGRNQPLLLSPIQQLHFQASDTGDALDQQTIVVRVTKPVDQESLIAGFEQLLRVHPMLRACFHTVQTHDDPKYSGVKHIWTQTITPESKMKKSLRTRFHTRQHIDYVFECVGEAKSSLNLETGPLVAVDFFEGKTCEQPLLSITIHHLIIDAVSWRILLRELEGFLLSGNQIDPERTSFSTWCHAQRSFADHLELRDTLPLDHPTIPHCDLSFWGMSSKSNFFKDTLSHKFKLDPPKSEILLSARETDNYDMADILCAAIIESFSEVFGRIPSLFIEGHGREPFRAGLDSSNTIGWFTTFSPVSIDKHRDNYETLRKVGDFRKNMPLNGFSYFTSRFLSSAGIEAFRERDWPMEVTLNHLGAFQQIEKLDSLFHRCDEMLQSKLSDLRRQQRANSTRYALFNVLTIVENGHLCLEVEWNRHMSHQDQIREWLVRTEQSLNDLPSKLAIGIPPKSSISASLPFTVALDSERLKSIVDGITCQLEIVPSEIEAIYPCSPIQNSLMLSQLKKPATVYRQNFLFQLIPSNDKLGPIESGRLVETWKAVVKKHPILRTIFFEDSSGTFLQVVLKSANPEIECFSLKDESEVPDIWTRATTATDTGTLTGKILHNLKIYTVDNGSAYCLISKNHLLTDGTTSQLLIRSFINTHDGQQERTFPYVEYIKYVCQQDMHAMTRYWNTYLDGAVTCNFPRLCQSVQGAHVQFARVNSTISNKRALDLTCRNLDLTSSAIFQASWALVLRTYLYTDDVVFGLLCSGRDVPIPGAQTIVGPMASILPIRSQLAATSTVLDLCKNMQHDQVEHLSRQTITLAEIQHNVKQSGESLFNTILNIQKFKGSAGQKTGSLRSKLISAHDASEYDVAVSIVDNSDDFSLTIEFPTHFMSETQAESLSEAFKTAVQTVIAYPEAQIGAIELATTMDKSRLKQWNSKPLEPQYRCIHDLISETTVRQPSRPAFCSWDGDLTYSELDLLSTNMAAQLQLLDVKPEDMIILCFEKSLWAVVSMLAVAKVGAAFIHIDPNCPLTRARAIIQQTESKLGIASSNLHGKLSLLVETVLVAQWESSPEEVKKDLARSSLPSPRICSSVDPSNTLYVIFTSGTTGTPKGVQIQHKSFCSAVAANRSWLQIESDSRVLQFTNYCFDASLEEIFTVLVAGGCICIPSESDRISDIPGFVKRKKVNWAAFTPSFLRTLHPLDLKTLKFITVHAEPMSQALVAYWAGKIHMRPSYGPTECSVTSTVGVPFTVESDASNIGYPVGCHAWVVNPENHDILMPIGSVGELLIDGPIVGKCYLNDAEKTAASFISPPIWYADFEPHVRCQTRRLYKTGDLVRYAEDGSLLIQRRKDTSQVKVRGQRIELKEIQYHLDSSAQIQHSIILMPTSGLLKGKLVAVITLVVLSEGPEFLVADANNQTITVVRKSQLETVSTNEVAQSLETITHALETQLPRYMLPEIWLVVEKLPVQLSHKLDRQRIMQWVQGIEREELDIALDLQRRDKGTCLCETKTEQTIQRIWGQVLGIAHDRISPDQSFFRLGGDSIDAIQVMRLCREAGLHLTTKDVLASPTVKQLADLSDQSNETSPSTSVVPMAENELDQLTSLAKHLLPQDMVESVLPCTPFQKRMYHTFHTKHHRPYLFNSLVELDADNLGIEGPERLLEAWQKTVQRHEILRTVFMMEPKLNDVFQIVLKWSKHESDASVVVVNSEHEVIEGTKLHLKETRQRMLEDHRKPPLSLRLFVTPEGRVWAHFIMGHILIDHVSLAIITSDWSLFHRQLDLTSEVPPFASYLDYLAQWRKLEESNQFWVDALGNTQPCIVDPEFKIGDHLAENEKEPCRMGAINFTIEVTDEMTEFCKTTQVTLSNLLQFAWALLLYKYTATSTICFGYLLSDRDIEIPNANQIVGPMLTLMIGKIHLTPSTNLVNALRNLQDHNFRSLSHRTFDLTKVEKDLSVDNETAGLFNTLVNYRKVRAEGTEEMVFRERLWKQDPHEQHLVIAFNEGVGGRKLDGQLTYYEEMFGEGRVREMVDYYLLVLGLVCSGKFVTVEELRRTGK